MRATCTIFQGIGDWAPADKTGCYNAAIRRLAETTVTTPSQAADVVQQLATASENPAFLYPLDVGATATILTNVAAVDGNLAVEVLQATVRSVSNVMEIEKSADLAAKNYTASIPYAVDVIAENVAKSLIANGSSDVVQFVEVHLIMTVMIAPSEAPITWPIVDLTHSTGASGCSLVSATCPGQPSEDDENTGLKVSLPSISSAVDVASGTGAVQIAVYDDDRLFKNSASAASTVNVKSKVLSVSIAGARDSGKFGSYARVSLSFPVQVNTSAAEIASRGCSYFGEATSEWLTDGCVVDAYKSSESLTVCSCDHLTSFAVLMDTDREASATTTDRSHQTALSIITYTGVGASLICIIVTMCVYLYFNEALNMTKTILLNLCVTLGLSLILFLIAMEAGLSGATCTAAGAGLHFFLLATFCWMLVEGHHIYHTFVTVFSKVESAHPVLRRAAFAYGAPAIVVGVSVGVWPDDYTVNDVCWLSSGSGTNNLIWGFVGPAGFVILVNLVVFVVIFVKIMTFTTTNYKRRSALAFAKRKAIRGAKTSFSFLTLLGVTWAFGIAMVFDPGSIGWQYAFSLFNAFLGVWIFFFQVMTDPGLRDAMRARGYSFPGSSRKSLVARKKSKGKGNEIIRNRNRPDRLIGNHVYGSTNDSSFRAPAEHMTQHRADESSRRNPGPSPSRPPAGFAGEAGPAQGTTTWVNGAPMMLPAAHWDLDDAEDE